MEHAPLFQKSVRLFSSGSLLGVTLGAVDSEEAIAAFIFTRVYHSGKDKYKV
jgi:hypothetical protein